MRRRRLVARALFRRRPARRGKTLCARGSIPVWVEARVEGEILDAWMPSRRDAPSMRCQHRRCGRMRRTRRRRCVRRARPGMSFGMSRRVSVRFRVGSGARIGATRRYHRAFSAAVDITPSRLMFLRRRRARPSRDAPAPRADRRGILVFPLLGFSPAVPQPRIDSYPTPPSLALVNSLPERRSPPPPRA